MPSSTSCAAPANAIEAPVAKRARSVGVRMVRRGTDDRLLLGGAVVDPGVSICVVDEEDVASARVDDREPVSDPVEEVSINPRAMAVVPVGANESDEVGSTCDRVTAVVPVNLTVDPVSVEEPGPGSRVTALLPVYSRRDSVGGEPADGRGIAIVPVLEMPGWRDLAMRVASLPSIGDVSADVVEPIPDISLESGLTRSPAYAATAK